MAYKVELNQEKNRYRVEWSGPIKGLDSKSPPTSIIEGHIPDLDSVDLPAGVPARMNGFALHDTTMTLPAGTEPTLLDRYYPSSSGGILSGTGEVYIAAGRDGKVYRWNAVTKAWNILRVGLSTATSVWWSSCQLADYLIFANPTDGIWKYDGNRVMPIGAKYIADMETDETTWSGGSADTALFKQGVQGRKTGVVASGATTTMTLTPPTSYILKATVNVGGTGYVVNDTGTVSGGSADATYIVDAVTAGVVTYFTIVARGTNYATGTAATATGGGQPGAGTGLTLNITAASVLNFTTALLQGAAYTTADKIHFWVNIDDTTHLDTAGTWIRFGNTGDTIYFQLTAAGWGTLVNGWNEISVLKSAFLLTGAPDWATIAKMSLATKAQVGNLNVTYDDVYVVYATTMPAAQVVVTWKNMLIGLSTTLNPSDFMYSKVSAPDYWDASAVFPISQNDGQIIRGAHPFYNQVVIGKTNSVHSVGGTVAGTIYPNYNLEHILITTEHGCSSHRSMIEAGNKVYMWWKNEIHRYFGTGTEKVSYKIDPTLNLVNKGRLHQISAARYRTSNELFFTYPKGASTTNDECIKYNYIEDAFIPVTAFNFVLLREAYESGIEYLLGAEYDGDIHRLDNGTTFGGSAITAFVTFPWTSCQRPDEMKSWDEIECLYQTNTGSLIVKVRTADHPREFDAATYTTIQTSVMDAVDLLGRFRIGTQRSRWMQLRLETVGASWTQYLPLIIYATPLAQKY